MKLNSWLQSVGSWQVLLNWHPPISKPRDAYSLASSKVNLSDLQRPTAVTAPHACGFFLFTGLLQPGSAMVHHSRWQAQLVIPWGTPSLANQVMAKIIHVVLAGGLLVFWGKELQQSENMNRHYLLQMTLKGHMQTWRIYTYTRLRIHTC